MQSFDQFYEEQILDEAGLKDAITDRASVIASNIIGKAKKLFAGLDFERKETMFMLETFFKQLRELLSKHKTVTEDDVKRALKQLGDVGKFALVAPLFLLPGGGTTTAVLYMAGKKLFNISILPQGLEQVFETMYDLKESLSDIQHINEGIMQNFDEWIGDKLNESSLSRIWRHVQDHQAGAISGYRDDNEKAQNKQNNREIKAYLTKQGYSVTSVQGNYIENFGSDNAREVGEPSFFVVDMNDSGRLERDLTALGKRFDQDSVLIVPQGGKGAYLLGTSNRDDAFPPLGQTERVGSSRFGKVAGQFLSRIRGREFAFECEEVKLPSTVNGKRGWAILAEKVKDDIQND